LSRRVQDRPVERLLHPHLPVNVLDLHRRVVDEDPDRQRHPAEGEGVQRLPQCPECGHRNEDGERDRDRDDHGGAPRPEEQEHHQGRQPGGDRGFLDDPFDRALNEHRLVDQDVHLEFGRELGLDPRQRLFHVA
jgi:hypothetical protein